MLERKIRAELQMENNVVRQKCQKCRTNKKRTLQRRLLQNVQVSEQIKWKEKPKEKCFTCRLMKLDVVSEDVLPSERLKRLLRLGNFLGSCDKKQKTHDLAAHPGF